MKVGKILSISEKDGKITSLKILWILLAFCVKFARNEEDDGEGGDGGEGGGGDTVSFNVLHISNLYSQVDELNRNNITCGGMPRIIHFVKEANKSKTPTLFFDTGDSFRGTMWFSVLGIDILIPFYKMLAPTAFALGEYDVTSGFADLAKFITEVGSPMLCCNCDFSKEPLMKDLIQRHIKITIAGTQIGIFSYITDQAQHLARGLENITIHEEIESIREEVQRLKDENVGIIILLGHGSFEEDRNIISKVDGIDLLVGGHSRTLAFKGKPPESASFMKKNVEYPHMLKNPAGVEVPVVYSYMRAVIVGKITLKFDKKGNLLEHDGNAVFLDDKAAKDPEAEEVLSAKGGSIKEHMDAKIGRSRVNYDGNKCNIQECNAGNLLADAYVEHVASSTDSKYWTDAAVAIVNAGMFTSAVTWDENDDTFTRGKAREVCPYENFLYIAEISGSTFRKAIHYSVSDSKIGNEKFLQYSGVHVKVNFGKKDGERLEMIKVRCADCYTPIYEPLDDNKKYKVIISDYLYHGGDGYAMFEEEAHSYEQLTIMAIQVLEKYIEFYDVIQTGHEERIIIIVPKDTESDTDHRTRSDSTLHKLDKYKILLLVTSAMTMRNICVI